jgi:hypothetical protein
MFSELNDSRHTIVNVTPRPCRGQARQPRHPIVDRPHCKPKDSLPSMAISLKVKASL